MRMSAVETFYIASYSVTLENLKQEQARILEAQNRARVRGR